VFLKYDTQVSQVLYFILARVSQCVKPEKIDFFLFIFYLYELRIDLRQPGFVLPLLRSFKPVYVYR